MIPALVTAAAPYLIPAAAYLVGHVVGWFHHKLTHPAAVKTISGQYPPAAK